jgi:hypothetical protein
MKTVNKLLEVIKVIIPYAAIYYLFVFTIEPWLKWYKATKKAAEELVKKAPETFWDNVNWFYGGFAATVTGTAAYATTKTLEFVEDSYTNVKKVFGGDSPFKKDGVFGSDGPFRKGGGGLTDWVEQKTKAVVTTVQETVKQSLDQTVQAVKDRFTAVVTDTPVGKAILEITSATTNIWEKVISALNLTAEGIKAATAATLALGPIAVGVKDSWLAAANRSRIEDIDALDSLEAVIDSPVPNAMWEGAKSILHSVATTVVNATNKIMNTNVENPIESVVEATPVVEAVENVSTTVVENITSSVISSLGDGNLLKFVGIAIFAVAAISLTKYGVHVRTERVAEELAEKAAAELAEKAAAELAEKAAAELVAIRQRTLEITEATLARERTAIGQENLPQLFGEEEYKDVTEAVANALEEVQL